MIDAILPEVQGVTTGCDLTYSTVIAYESDDESSEVVTQRIESYVTFGETYTDGTNKKRAVTVTDSLLFFPNTGTYDITVTAEITAQLGNASPFVYRLKVVSLVPCDCMYQV